MKKTFRITHEIKLSTETHRQFWVDYSDGSGSAVSIDLDDSDLLNPNIEYLVLQEVKRYAEARCG